MLEAFPLAGFPPDWIHVTDTVAYAGSIGDGGLSDSAVIPIDTTTLTAETWIVPAPFDGAESWPGIQLRSWSGDVRVDVDALDGWFSAP